jgi:phosphatidylinositol alpha-1,6-mannosyltransferase
VNVDDWLMTNARIERAKARLGINGRPTVLFPGHYARGMGAEAMLKALPQIASKVPNAHMIFACRSRSSADRAVEAAIRKELEAVGLMEHVSFFNTVPDMENLIAASDVLALPLENMRDKIDIPTSLLEFLSAGKPIIITDIAPMNEIFGMPNGSRVGIKVPPGDFPALGRAIIELLADAEQRKQMGAAGRELVAAHYDIRKVALQYDQLYQESTR